MGSLLHRVATPLCSPLLHRPDLFAVFVTGGIRVILEEGDLEKRRRSLGLGEDTDTVSTHSVTFSGQGLILLSRRRPGS